MINTAVVLVDADKQLAGAPVACAGIFGVPLLKRILIDLRRAGFENIYVLLNRADHRINEVLDDTEPKVKFNVRQISDDWRSEIIFVNDRRALVLSADRLSDFRLLENLSQTGVSAERAIITYDNNDPAAPRLNERKFRLNDGRVVQAEEVSAATETGVYVLPTETISGLRDLKFETLKEAALIFRQKGKAVYFDIGNGFVQPIESRADIKVAERRLIRYIYKATDEKHARLNKRILMPFLKLVLKTPLTPNIISLIGVMVSLLSGYFFAQGAYLYSLLGAFLALVSGLLDHVDGSVARLKSKESAFGAHFETVCDFIFYFVFGVGITVGLYRNSGNSFYIFLGVAAFFGTLISLLMISYQRKRFVKNPSLYAAEAHRKIDQTKPNPLIRYGRMIYFIIRRPVLPYYLIILTALKLLPFVLFMTAFSANLFWILLAYSIRLTRTTDSASVQPVGGEESKPLSL